MRTYIEVPYRDKNRAKEAGAKFDPVWHKWFVEDDIPEALKHYPHVDIDNLTSIELFMPLGDIGHARHHKRHVAYALVCDEADVCPLAKSGLCVSLHGSRGAVKCPCARCTCLTQSSKDPDFADRIRAMDAYRALAPTGDIHFAHVGSKWAYLRTPYAHIAFDPDKATKKEQTFSLRMVTRSVSDPDFVLVDTDGGELVAERDRITPELLHELVCLRPTSWGKYVHEFTNDFVPRFLDEVRRMDSDLMARYEELFDTPARPSFVGRKAFVTTCAIGSVWNTEHGTLTLAEDEQDGLVLRSDDWSDLMTSIPGMRRIVGATLLIPVTPDMTIEITDDSQVTELTMFR